MISYITHSATPIVWITLYTGSLAALDSSKYEKEIRLAPQQCLQLITSGRTGANGWVLRYFNACGDKIYANACVEERPGKFKLHKSGGKIPSLGYWNIYSYEGSAPISVALATSRGSPEIPGQCTSR